MQSLLPLAPHSGRWGRGESHGDRPVGPVRCSQARVDACCTSCRDGTCHPAFSQLEPEGPSAFISEREANVEPAAATRVPATMRPPLSSLPRASAPGGLARHAGTPAPPLRDGRGPATPGRQSLGPVRTGSSALGLAFKHAHVLAYCFFFNLESHVCTFPHRSSGETGPRASHSVLLPLSSLEAEAVGPLKGLTANRAGAGADRTHPDSSPAASSPGVTST